MHFLFLAHMELDVRSRYSGSWDPSHIAEELIPFVHVGSNPGMLCQLPSWL